MNLYRCLPCAEKGGAAGSGYFKANAGDTAHCVQCNRPAAIVMRSVDSIHYAIADADGKLSGADGRRWTIACSPNSPSLTAQPHSDNWEAVSCAACKAHPVYQERKR